MKYFFAAIFFLLLPSILYCQDDKDILLTINDEAITVGEFKRVYLKNIDLVDEVEEKRGPEKYLELFIPYKLKVQEAYSFGLDKKDGYKNELNGYKKQLAKTFLTDVSISEELVREAYDRTVNEVKARHILVKIAPNASPEDTLKAYNKIIEARNKVLSGEDFATVARNYSEGPSGKTTGGDLGWFKAFKMLYSFENAAYSTPLNQVSLPFKTRYGYHIVQTTGKREAQGSVQVAHIMISHKQEDTAIVAKERIQKMYTLLQKGEDFESLAKTYSNDKQTAIKGGEIKPFERGQLRSPEFEKVAFGLTKPQEISKPFETKYGWHIVKLLKKIPIRSFDVEKIDLENKVKKDKRSQVISESLIKKLRKQYDLEDISYIVKIVENENVGSFQGGSWVFSKNSRFSQKELFTLRDSTYLLNDLGAYLERTYSPKQFGSKDQFFEQTTRKYVDTKIRLYHQDHLEEIDDEFASVLREYQEGLLIFDLMEQKIWSVARKDTLGLQKYYEENKDKYIAPERAVGIVYTSQSKKSLEDLKKALTSGVPNDTPLNSKDVLKTTKEIEIINGTVERFLKPELGVSNVFTLNNGYVLYNILEIKPKKTETLEEAKGAVISDYQKDLEEKWIQTLQSKATINVNKKVLKKLKKQYD